jgi:hypothetical protein
MERKPAMTQHEYLFSFPFSIFPLKTRPPPSFTKYLCQHTYSRCMHGYVQVADSEYHVQSSEE